jgi:hypothetical protein
MIRFSEKGEEMTNKNLWLTAVMLGVSLAADAAPEDDLLFYAPFDGTAEAAEAKGAKVPVEAKALSYDAGLRGQAVRLSAETDAYLSYSLTNNAVPSRGTVAFWYKPEWNSASDKRWRFLFGFALPPNQKRLGSGAVRVWYYGGVLRAETSDKADSYRVSVQPINTGEWRHIAFTWDETGSMLYVNGKPLRSKRDDENPLAAALHTDAATGRRQYDRAGPFASFQVGCARDGKQADGLIDELRIYSAPISEKRIQAWVSEYATWDLSVARTYFLSGRDTDFRASVSNRSGQAHAVSWRLEDASGRVVQESAQPAAVPAFGTLDVAFAFSHGSPGPYALNVSGTGTFPVRRTVWGMRADNPYEAQPGDLKRKLVETLVLDRTPDADRFASTGGHTFQTLNGVRYLEAGTGANDRFAIRFHLPDTDPLYCFEWDYPDDKTRTADVIVQPSAGPKSDYELQVGTFTGDEYPCQNRMLTARCLYWAPTQDVSVVFMTARSQAPAAVSRIRLYKVEGGLPRATVSEPAPVDGWHRTLALYYEDPAIAYDFAVSGSSMPGFETLIDRTAAYMKYAGMNLFAYPGVWYHGRIGDVYNPRNHAENFLEAWFAKFDAEGLGVMPTFNEQTLPLPDGMTLTKQSLSDGTLCGSFVSVFDTGMPNPGGWHGTPPNFNILHPYVQQRVMDEVDALLAQGAGHPSFKGIDLRLAEHSFHWLGSIRAGYNDYMIDAFTRDTGIRVPVDRADPLRGKAYAEWLMANARAAWVDWRCRAVAAWHKRIAAKLASARPDLRLSLTLLTPMHPARGEAFDDPHYIDRLNREAGVDARLYADAPNIVISQGLRPARYRAGYDRPQTDRERQFLRDVFNTRAYYESLDAAKLPWLHLHDHYWESPVGDPTRRKKTEKALTAPWLKEEPWRVTTLNPASYYALRSYVLPLRYHDLLGIARGGFLIGTYGMEEHLVPFAKAFRALPAKPFADVPGCGETVKVRSLQFDGQTWFYAVNTGDQPAEVTIAASASEVTDLVTGQPPVERNGASLNLRLTPYQLRSFRASGGNGIAVVSPEHAR